MAAMVCGISFRYSVSPCSFVDEIDFSIVEVCPCGDLNNDGLFLIIRFSPWRSTTRGDHSHSRPQPWVADFFFFL
jgi:hypothetical protein